MRSIAFLALVVFFLPEISFGQAVSSRCDSIKSTLEGCTFLTRIESAQNVVLGESATPAASLLDQGGVLVEISKTTSLRATNNDLNTNANMLVAAQPPRKQGFHWGRALLESFTLLSIEHAYVVHSDWRWVGGDLSENGVPFNHYWRDYKQSLSAWVHSGWSDGDPNMYGYVGHPIQGVATSYIYLQNDPESETLEFSKTKAYWWSRLKATLWNAVYSTQWNIGPLSEATVEKYGTHHRPPWNQNGSWPCTTRNCYTGMGQIDLVMTPVGGFGWLVGEDFLDKKVTRRVEGATRNRFLIDVTRCGLDPIRVGTNFLHGKRPWYRASRDARDVYASSQLKKLGTSVPQSH